VILLLQRGESACEKRSFQLGKVPPEGGTTNFSLLVLTDQVYRHDRRRAASSRNGKRNWNTPRNCLPDGTGSIGVTNLNCCGGVWARSGTRCGCS